jgi:hypothetical protein
MLLRGMEAPMIQEVVIETIISISARIRIEIVISWSGRAHRNPTSSLSLIPSLNMIHDAASYTNIKDAKIIVILLVAFADILFFLRRFIVSAIQCVGFRSALPGLRNSIFIR